MRVGGWSLVGWTALVVGALSGAMLLVHGSGPEGIGAVLRMTARSSALLFSAAFAASSLQRLLRSGWTRELLRNRRYLGVSLGVSHAIHLGAIAALVAETGQRPDAITLAVGGSAYLLLTLMVATSFDRSAAWLGPRRWRQLHTTGGYTLWFVFIFTFGTSIAEAPQAALTAAAFVALLATVLGLRLYARRWRPAAARAA